MRSLFLTAFGAALLVTLVMAWLPHPPAVPWHEDDKLWHAFAFVVLALLASLAFPGASLSRLGERLSFLGAVIEIVQSIPALHRDCDVSDWIADTIAIAAALVLAASLRRFRARRPGRAAAPAAPGG